MPVIEIKQRGDLSRTMRFLKKLKSKDFLKKLDDCGKMGVSALSIATPKRTGKTAASWTYEIHATNHSVELVWINTNINKGENVAVLIQYGHGTRTGGYVQGIDYINPTMVPLFEKMANEIWQEVISDE